MIYRLCRLAVSVILCISLVVQSPVAALEPEVVAEVEMSSPSVPAVPIAEDTPTVTEAELDTQAASAISDNPAAEGAMQNQDLSEANEPAVPTLQPEEAPDVAETSLTGDDDPLPPVDDPIKVPLPPMITEVMVSGKCADPAVCTGNNVEFVELFNPNSEESLQLAGMKLRYQSGTSSTEVDLVTLDDVTLEPGEIVVFGRNMPALKPLLQQLADTGGSIRLVKGAQLELLDQVGWGKSSKYFYVQSAAAPATGKSLQRCFVNKTLVNLSVRDTSSEFVVYPNELPTPGVALACPVLEPEPEINLCEGLRLSEIAANAESQFIEIYNSAEAPLDMTGCRLQTNRSAVFYSLPEKQLQPGEYYLAHVASTGLSLTKTTIGTVYLLSSDGGVELDSQSYSRLATGTSWALFLGGEWRQTYLQTPGLANQYQQYLPCEAGYERNEETGRCRKIAEVTAPVECGDGKYRNDETGRCKNLVVEAAVTPCNAGQYRSPETNRCRNLTLASSGALTPCKAGQERNPDTNRCRAIASTVATTLKPCAAGQERNAETNRCRKVVSGDGTAGFKAVDTPNSPDKLLSWLALGGVGAMSLGYMAWEWRRELVGGIGKALSFLPFVK